MTLKQKVKAAEKAIEAVYSDTSVSKADTQEALRELHELIETYLEILASRVSRSSVAYSPTG